MTSQIDLTRLDPLLNSIGWTREQAERAFKADFSQPVSSELKKQLWEVVRTARLWRQFFPSTRIETMKFMKPGGGGG